jgi:hypothetical protein
MRAVRTIILFESVVNVVEGTLVKVAVRAMEPTAEKLFVLGFDTDVNAEVASVQTDA